MSRNDGMPATQVQSAPPINPSTESEAKQEPYADLPFKQPVVHPTADVETTLDGWFVAKSGRGTFSAELPFRFVNTTTKAATKTGTVLIFHSIVTDRSEEIEFNILETEFLGERPKEAADFVSQLVNRSKSEGANVVQSPVTVANISGDKLEISKAGVSAETYFLRTQNRDFMIMIQWRPPVPGGHRGRIDRFIASIAIDVKDEVRSGATKD